MKSPVPKPGFSYLDASTNLYGMSYTYPYPRPMVTVDSVVFRVNGATTEVLLIRRGNDPYKNSWAFPGGFIGMDETLLESAKRELHEETGLKDIRLKQLYTFGDPGRDPRGRVVTVVFAGQVEFERSEVKGADDADEARWFDLSNLPALAFDHEKVLEKAIAWYARTARV